MEGPGQLHVAPVFHMASGLCVIAAKAELWTLSTGQGFYALASCSARVEFRALFHVFPLPLLSPPPFFSSSLPHSHQWNCSMSRLLTCMRWQERVTAASTTSRVMRPGDGTYLVHLAS